MMVRANTTALLVLLFAATVLPAEEAPPLSTAAAAPQPPLHLNITWKDPQTGAPLDWTFRGDALVAIQPGAMAHLKAVLGGWRARFIAATLRTGHQKRQLDLEKRPHDLTLAAETSEGPVFYDLTLEAHGSEETVTVCLFVPYTARITQSPYGKVYVQGKHVTTYRDPTRSGQEKVNTHPEAYQPPQQWLRMTDATRRLWITPWLRLEEMVMPSERTGKRHTDCVPVPYTLLTAIETFRAALRKDGIDPAGLTFLSLFRTPGYNRGIGSGSFSRHGFCDAFDYIIDNDGDGTMDDLTGDGKVDREDALRLIRIEETLQAENAIPIGGIGAYTFAYGDHTVTMHLDLRGHRARWAYHHRGRRKTEWTWESEHFAAQDRAEEEARKARAGR